MVKKSVNLLPAFFRTDKNSKFLSSTLDQFIKDPQLERLDGFIGSKLSKNYDPITDQYITYSQPLRNRYQLEPGLVIKNLDKAITKAYGYDDLINQVSYHSGNVDNLDRLFRPKHYSYDPNINWDKLVNFREYYWLPTGPNPIKVTGTQREVVSTYTVTEDSTGNFFVLSPDGLTPDPLITLYRGVTYVFDIKTTRKFYIRKNSGYGVFDLYSDDVIGNGTSQVIISITNLTPDELFYASDSNQITGGQFVIKTIDENSFIDVDREIVGKKQYRSGNGVEFINGLKISFGGDVRPSTYRNKDFIVEGVGDKITLIDFNLLETPEYVGTQVDPDFDVENFDDYPFDDFRDVPIDPSYITINRASRDLNSWARYNRWFHADVILATNPEATLPIENRASRPIIEFAPNLQLFNFGHTAIENIDLIDNYTIDAFSAVEGSDGYWVDGVLLDQGFKVIFNADNDPFVHGKVFEVRIDIINGVKKINLVEDTSTNLFKGACTVVTKGETSAGTCWWYNGNDWVQGQQRTYKNQPPLFDIFDSNGFSYSGTPYTSDFKGTRIFGYADGTVFDSVLGLNLKYRTTGLESSYVFANFFTTDHIVRLFPDISITIPVSSGYLKSNDDASNPRYLNVWREAAEYLLPVIQFQELFDAVDSIEITTFDNPGTISDLTVTAFVNDVKTSATISTEGPKAYVNFARTIPASTKGTKIRLNFYTKSSPNSTGTYETPINLTNNPLNGPVAELILSELYDHVQTMVDRDPDFSGIFPGSSNLGNLPNTSIYGSRIISSKNPIAFAHQFISNKSNNLIEATAKAGEDYNQFKLNLIKTIGEIDDQYTPQEILDIALAKLNENKNTTFPYFLSDMVPSGTNKKTRKYTVTDSRNTSYSITSIFSLTSLSNNAVLVYLNGTQLIAGKDYVFELYDTTVTFLIPLIKGDNIVIEEYLNTDGSFITPTPTKLGLFPKFVPEIFEDTSYATGPRNVIQGHDGSLLLAFNDYRDAVILEYEKRIYNNIKTTYNPELLDINSILPGVFRNEEYEYAQLYSSINSIFLKWSGFYGIDFEDASAYDVDNHKTYNYKSAVDSMFNKTLPGSWRAVYKYYFDTDRPDTHPWEMLGITVKPDWWDEYYGPFPYTSGNLKLWTDLEEGRIAQGPNAGINPVYARPGLSQVIPVDTSGNLIDIRQWGPIGLNDSIPDTNQPWAFGDWGPAENAWRRSSYWPFALQILISLAKPADYASAMFDPSRLLKNKAGQYVYGEANEFLSTDILALHGDTNNGQTVRAAGFGVYVIEMGKKRSVDYLSNLKVELKNSDFNLFAKLGGFVSKDKLSIIIDAVQLGSQNPAPYLPDTDYTVHFNTSNPIKTIAISGIIVIKTAGAFVIRGYDKKDLFFKVYQPIHEYSDAIISVGSKSEEFVTWAPNQFYNLGQIVYHENIYYRVSSDHKSSDTFEVKYYRALTGLPTVGGTRVAKTTKFENVETIIPYGKEMQSIQEVYDFLAGYGKWLEAQGFVFDDYNSDFQQTIDWDFTAKEFIYWTNQNWALNSVITLSPFANALKFRFQDGIVDNVFDSFYEYNLLRADGLTFPPNNFSLIRDGNEFVIKTKNTPEGIFFAKLNLVQKEHALVFNNTTIFNDVLYDIDTGYRQLRVKVKGFKTAEWNGDFFSPGFVYDNASIEAWKPYSDYMPGDLVEYVGKYYSAKKKITGTEKFDFSLWIQLTEKPVASLLPNFEYKINQFEDFYSLDIDNFDISQQQMAQHLIGYSPRSYLENIFDNPISQYKFYQGFIKEKGTKNTLTKLEKASVANLQGKIEFDEEWAFRIGYFGGFSSFNEIELPLREQDFNENVQEILFVSDLPAALNNATSYITPSDLTIKPTSYVAEHTFLSSTGTYLDNNLLLPHAGYVRTDDVDFITTTTSALLDTADIRSFKEGDTIWVGFEPAGEWNVYRYTRQSRYITSAVIGNVGTLVFTTDSNHDFKVGDKISITRVDTDIDGIYEITAVPSLTTFAVATSLTYIVPTEVQGVIFRFNKVRFSDVDDIATLSYIADVKEGDLFWVDNNGTGKWAVYRKIDNYNASEYIAPRGRPGQQFGYRIAKQETSSTIVVSAARYYEPSAGGTGKIYVYRLASDNTIVPVVNYSLNSPIDEYRPTSDPAIFGDSIFYDDTDDLIFASASRANGVRHDATAINGVKEARSINAGSTLTNVGLVKISGVFRQGYPDEIPYAVLVTPETANGTRFGTGLFVERTAGEKKVLIGAPGQSSNAGKVYIFDLSIDTNERNFYGVTGTNAYGVGASFDVEIVGRAYNLSIVNTGTGYTTSSFANSTILIQGSQLGGRSNSNNLIINITSTGTNGSIVSYTSSGTAALSAFTIVAPTQASLTQPVSAQSKEFGYRIAGNKAADRIAVSAPGSNTGTVYIYQFDNNTYTLSQTISGNDAEFTNKLGIANRLGDALSMSEDGNYLFVGSMLATDDITKRGKVWVYKWNGEEFVFLQLLNNPSLHDDVSFGKDISLNSAADILAITAQGANFFADIIFDGGATTFDANACLFGDTDKESGTTYIYNRYNEKFILSQELYDNTVDSGSYYGESVVVNDHKIYVGSPGSLRDNYANGSVYIWDEINPDVNSWEQYRVQEPLVDISLLKNATTIDTLEGQVIDYLDIIDPLKGKIAGLADQEIRYKTPFDPAVYNLGTDIVVVDQTSHWGSAQVGQLWWDLSTTKYIWYEQSDRAYRKNSWGQLFPGASIDVYEWVETTYLPSQWAALADTNEGIAAGISGKPKFADDTIYVSSERFNTNTNQFVTLYYFWVLNKTIVPTAENRRIAASDVASLIRDPKSYGLRYLSVISPNSCAIVNFKSKLIGNQIYLNISSGAIESDINNHTEWVIVPENSQTGQVPPSIERKMIDSLLGKDSVGNLVPDPALPVRLRYGVEIRPKQSMFVNRIEALRNVMDYTNSVLATTLTRGFIDFTNLNSKEEIPDIVTGEYDLLVETVEERDLLITVNLIQAELSCTVLNGRIVGVDIVNPGFGYLVAPAVTILNNQTDARIKTEIDASGSIIAVSIYNPGYGFVTAPALSVRPFAVIVQTDPDFSNKWSKYEWINEKWERIHTQKYDTTLYWNYINWVDSSFNEFKPLTYTVDELYELDTLELVAGDYIKVKNPGDNKYIILRKTETGVSGTFSSDYDIIFSEDGTIRISDSVWDTGTAQLGFDDVATFDQFLYDETAEIELQKIIYAIKNDIFVGPMKMYWNKFFFKCVKYALTEQRFLDWAFKTSFINVKNVAGVLDQRTTYRFQDPAWYENYLKEIKPYHTQIRNYQINYQIGETQDTPYELSSTFTTDFDLPAVYDRGLDVFKTVSETDPLIDTYPYKSWADNKTYQIDTITLTSGGSGYRLTPEVRIIPAPGDTGTGASARAYIALGKVVEIELIDGGTGYTKTPSIVIVGGGDALLTPATAYAELANGKVRTNKIGMKFDRISPVQEFAENTFTDTFVSSGTDFEYVLTWYASTDKSITEVIISGILVPETDYSIVNYTELFNGYHKKYSKIVLSEVPAIAKVIVVNYTKNIEIYSASDRILEYYSPEAGMPGKQLEQLMKGVTFSGSQVKGLPFIYSAFWDSTGFGESSWDDSQEVESFFTIITATTNAFTFVTPVINTSTILNVYVEKWGALSESTENVGLLKSKRIDSTSTYGIVNPITGTNTTASITVPQLAFTDLGATGNFYKVVLRTPDQGSAFTSNDLDTVISGGSFTTGTNGLFNTARGLAVSDIILDGDGFVTPNTSYGPEEMVPGQVLESVSISVFTRDEKGSPAIINQSAVIDNTTATTTINLPVSPANTSSVMVNFNGNALVYGRDFSVNFIGKTVTINTQSTTGVLGITTVGVGGSEIIAARSVTSNTSTVTIRNVGLYSEIGSLYVTANGETLSSTSTGLGYTFSTVSSTNLGGKLVVRGLTGPSIVQAWFFKPTYKAYSEVKEQIVTLTSTQDTFALIQVPGTVGPLHAQAIVELDGLRLTPPDTTYYSVEADQIVFDIRPDQNDAPGVFNLSQLEVHVNGKKQRPNTDFILDQLDNQIVFNPGNLTEGDVLAITILLGADYVIENDNLVLTTPATAGQLLKIITYTNHDASNIRTEVFSASSSRQVVMNRPIFNDNYVWVSVAGRPLISRKEYAILDDNKTIELSPEYEYNIGDKIVVTSFNDSAVTKSVGYRIFKDMLGKTHYNRYSEQNTTFLAQPLAVTDSVIYVDNAVILTVPSIPQNTPGVVWIGGERIEYFTKSGNVLGQLRRTTLGTGADSDIVYPAGTAVIDQGSMQSIPNSDAITKQTFTATSTTTYNLTTISLNSQASAHDQIEVFYAGRLLQKPTAPNVTRYKHDNNIAYDSNEYGSDIVQVPDFTISGTSLVLSFNPIPGTRITVLKNTDQVWYNLGDGTATDGLGLLSSDTAQAQFLLEKQSGLPDKYQYGQD